MITEQEKEKDFSYFLCYHNSSDAMVSTLQIQLIIITGVMVFLAAMLAYYHCKIYCQTY